jgi:hypothetical protein
MIDVSVGQNHDVDVDGAKPQVPVAVDAFRPASLEKAAIEQDTSLLGVNEMP